LSYAAPAVVMIFTWGLTGCSSQRGFADGIATPQWDDLTSNVQKYTTLVDGLESKLPALGPKADAQEIAAHKKQLAEAIRDARSGARPGDVFSPAIRDRLLGIIHSEVHGPEGTPAKQAILEDNPAQSPKTRPVTLAVNAPYPEGAPLSTVPPTLLLRLPELPKTLDYRFVGRALVLRDVRANMIVDYIPNALS
jgi:outer membrane murein-binding lipoprotein Lpp